MSRLQLAFAACSISLLVACGDAEEAHEAELVASLGWNQIQAAASDGESLLIARRTELDRIDARSGALTRLAGVDFACGSNSALSYIASSSHASSPRFFFQANGVYSAPFGGDLCRWDTSENRSRPLTSHVLKTGETLWNGQAGPSWGSAYDFAMAPDTDGFVACLSVATDGRELERHVEVWSFAPDGTPRERWYEGSAESERCSGISAQKDVLVVASHHAIFTVDRATRAVRRVSVGTRPNEAFAVDASRIFWVGESNEIVSVQRDGSGFTQVLEGGAAKERRTNLAVDDEYIYYFEWRSLRRVGKTGGRVEELFPEGGEEQIVRGVGPILTDQHVYFETERPSYGQPSVYDDTTGHTFDAWTTFTLRRIRK